MNSNVYHITYSPKFETVCLYFEGCNFRCLGCIRRKCNFDVHLPPHQLQYSIGKIRNWCGGLPTDLQRNLEKTKITNLTKDEILDILSKVKPKKVIFMGGEPTIDPNFVSLTKELKIKLGVYNTLLTNGYNFVDLRWIDEVCVGIKAASPRLHKEYTGKDSKTVFRNLKKLDKEKRALRTESIFIPGYVDIKETKDIAYAISRVNPNIPHRIDGYIPVPGTKWRRPNLTEIKEAVRVAKRYLKEVHYIKVNKRKSSAVRILL